MSAELRRDLAFVATLLADVVAALASMHGEVSRLSHRGRQALQAVHRLRAEVDEHGDLERGGAS